VASVRIRRASALALAILLTACVERGSAPRVDPPTALPSSRVPSPQPVAVSPAPAGSAPATEHDRFAGRVVSPLPASLAREVRGTTWKPGCPIPLSALALLRFNWVGFDHTVHRGSMVVNAQVATDVLSVFRALYEARFPIRHVALAKEFRPNADPNTRSSVTASFNCRPIVTPAGVGDRFSMHAYGLAVDVNPLQNPYVAADGYVRDRFARPYRDRSQHLPGMLHDGDVVVRAFAAIGWGWGGDWSGGKDYMHFSANGR
jgi:D-alanyl-D-alanine carboxypeptidase